MFRWVSLIVIAFTLSISGYSRYRARQKGASIRRKDEPTFMVVARLLVTLPLFGSILAYLINPPWVEWALVDLPEWMRWIGVVFGVSTIPMAVWVFSSLGSNVSETVLTRSGQELVTVGPYHWIRHPLYATGALLLIAIGLMAANGLILVLSVLTIGLILWVVIPREEAALIDRFGAAYKSYMTVTGRLIPKMMKAGIREILFLLLVVLVAIPESAQVTPDTRRAWAQPWTPFHLIGNIYYVGASGVSAFLITTSAGSILLDGGLPETAGQIQANIKTLGFRVNDVKYLLNSHAHFDHAGGLAELKRTSGASMVASAGDAPALRAGGADMPPVVVDRVVNDGESVKLGDATLTAVITPGHTKGCTTWTMTAMDNGKPRRVLFFCSTSVVDRLVGNERYPEIVADYERSFKRLKTLDCDVFLGPHPAFFSMAEKVAKMKSGVNPFIDPKEMSQYVEQSEKAFRAELAKQTR